MSSVLETITKNPMLKKMAFGALKKAFATEGITLIAVTTDKDGELSFNTYTEKVAIVVDTSLTALVEKHRAAIEQIAELQTELSNTKQKLKHGH